MRNKLTSYTFRRAEDGEVILLRNIAGASTKIEPSESLKLCNHSPHGFNFGYGGSGPAQLALAILLDFTQDKDLACERYQDFKFQFIANVEENSATISAQEIMDFLSLQRPASPAKATR